jgi:hypothetical protein
VVFPSAYKAYFLALLVGGRAVQYFDLAAVVKLRFANELMRRDLRHLLSIIIQVKHLHHPLPSTALLIT